MELLIVDVASSFCTFTCNAPAVVVKILVQNLAPIYSVHFVILNKLGYNPLELYVCMVVVGVGYAWRDDEPGNARGSIAACSTTLLYPANKTI